MAAFPTPYEMFEEYMDHELKSQFSLERKMMEYARKAEDRIGEYVECIAEAYINGYKKAACIFEDAGLKPIHAFAVLQDEEGFNDEFEEQERSWEDYQD